MIYGDDAAEGPSNQYTPAELRKQDGADTSLGM